MRQKSITSRESFGEIKIILKKLGKQLIDGVIYDTLKTTLVQGCCRNRKWLNRHSKKADFPGEAVDFFCSNNLKKIIIQHNGEIINQPVDIANSFNTFFAELEKNCPIAFMLTTSFMEHTKNIFGPQPI